MGCSSTNDTYGIDLWRGLSALDDSRVSIPWGVAPGWYETRLRRFIALENDRSALAQMYKLQGQVFNPLRRIFRCDGLNGTVMLNPQQ